MDLSILSIGGRQVNEAHGGEMEPLSVGGTIGAIASLVSLIGGAFLATYRLGIKAGIAKQGHKVGALEEKVRGLEERLSDVKLQLDSNDEFTLNIAQTLQSRAELRAEEDGMIDSSGSSIKLTPFWREKLAPFKQVLVDWYHREGRYLPEWKVFWVFDHKFRSQIVKYICRPNKLNDLKCLIAALLLCKESSDAFTQAGEAKPPPKKNGTDQAIPLKKPDDEQPK